MPATEFEPSWLPMSRKPQVRRTVKPAAFASANTSSTIVRDLYIR
jgi:hypothetical protein